MNTETIVVTQPPTFRKGFFQACFDSYSKLVDSPFVFFLFIVTVFSLIAEINNSYGPLELFSNALLAYCNDGGFLRPIALILLSFITLVIKYKISFLLSLLFIIPSLLDSSLSTWLLSLLFVLISFISSLDIYKLFLFSQFYYMYIFVDNHFYKALLLLFAFIVFLLGYQHFSSIIGVS